jgi:hypothetical protein
MAKSPFVLLIHASGKETHCLKDEVPGLSVSFQFAGWRDGKAVFAEEKRAYWWNGHDTRPGAMHKPGEVCS